MKAESGKTKKSFKSVFDDKDIHTIIGELLRWGIIISSVLVLAGGITFLIRHGASKADYTVFHAESSIYLSLGKIIHGVLEWKGKDVIQLGLIVLIATPTARLLFSLVSFMIEKDRIYIIITLIVLSVIAFSMFSGMAG